MAKGVGKNEHSYKTVKCRLCNDEMLVDGASLGGQCWRCTMGVKKLTKEEELKEIEFMCSPEGTLYHKQKRAAEKQGRVFKVESKDKEDNKDVENTPIKPPRSIRLGQTKVIDELLKQGMKPEEVVEEVAKRIPQYPKAKLPALVKVRMYHLKMK